MKMIYINGREHMEVGMRTKRKEVKLLLLERYIAEMNESERSLFAERIVPYVLEKAKMAEKWKDKRISMLVKGKNGIVQLSKDHAECLLACSVIDMLPSKHHYENMTLPNPCISKLFSLSDEYDPSLEKIKCVFQFFETMALRRINQENVAPNENLFFVRRCLPNNLETVFAELNVLGKIKIEQSQMDLCDGISVANVFKDCQLWFEPRLNFCQISMHLTKTELAFYFSSCLACPLEIHQDGTIEDDPYPSVQVDFANRMIGGGVLGYGAVQEEIRFAISPELILSLAFAEAMLDRESLLLIGTERFSNYRGYAKSFKFAGPALRQTDAEIKYSQIIAIDALPFPGLGDALAEQCMPEIILRELNKALVGFLPASFGVNLQEKTTRSFFEKIPHAAIATGNWGAGAFGGNAELKMVIQWIACSLCNRPLMRYYTFKNKKVSLNALHFLEQLHCEKLNRSDPLKVLELMAALVYSCCFFCKIPVENDLVVSVCSDLNTDASFFDVFCSILQEFAQID